MRGEFPEISFKPFPDKNHSGVKRQHLHVWKRRILHEDGIVNGEVKLCCQVLHMILAFENAQSEKEAVENAHFTEDSAQRTFTHHCMSIHVQNISCIGEKISPMVDMSGIIRTDNSRDQLKQMLFEF